jgi:hypothetical protein
MHLLSHATALLAVTACVACSRGRPSEVTPELPAFVEVRNQAFLDMNVYVLRGGARVRLGTVMGNSTAVFEIPRAYVNPGLPVRFMADPIGSNRTPYSHEIPINPGDRIVLTIPPTS